MNEIRSQGSALTWGGVAHFFLGTGPSHGRLTMELFFFDSCIRSFGQELLVLHTRLFMFGTRASGACLESLCNFEGRTFYIGSLQAKLILTCQIKGAKMSLIWNVLCSTLHTDSKHALTLTDHQKFRMQTNQLSTKKLVESKDNFNVRNSCDELTMF